MRDRYTFKAISEGDGKVHERVDQVMKDFVQKDDLREFLKPLTDSISQMQQEQRATTQRIDQVLAMVPRRATD